jgi:hypothetical protein
MTKLHAFVPSLTRNLRAIRDQVLKFTYTLRSDVRFR